MEKPKVKLCIAGTRTFSDERLMAYELSKIQCLFEIVEVVSGGAKGADLMGEKWAIANNIPIKRFPADWKKHGKSAGPIRNDEMAKYADAFILFWDEKSRGTADMITRLHNQGKLLSLVMYSTERPFRQLQVCSPPFNDNGALLLEWK